MLHLSTNAAATGADTPATAAVPSIPDSKIEVPGTECDVRPATQPPVPNSQLASPRGEGESDRACEAFRVYLELGPKRRYAAVGRKVGASLRTVRRWACDFDWRGRIKAYAAQAATQYAETESTVRREDLLDAAARAKAFRDRQYSLAETLLDTVERYLENVDRDDLDHLSFSDACKALEVASRLGQNATNKETDDASATSHGLRDQLTALLDHAYGGASAQKGTADQPGLATTPKSQS